MNNLNRWKQLFNAKTTPICELAEYKGVSIVVKRDDVNHTFVQGNKLRKLKYNLKQALSLDIKQVATFGGAWSNHIAATASAAQYCGLKSIGFIRGDELQSQLQKWSPTLMLANARGMQFKFLSRSDYRLKLKSEEVLKYIDHLKSNPLIIPEGGSNQNALIGVAELVDELSLQVNAPSHLICACGTGGTLAGIIIGCDNNKWNTQVIGIPVLKGADFLRNDIRALLGNKGYNNWKLQLNYHGGGYAKSSDKLRVFSRDFFANTGIELDKIYNAKSFFATFDLIDRGIIAKGSQVVIVHTGGLQGGAV